ncbi:ead/Ea22-like family protein [Klebsiella variicola subsp. variicola]|nr:ead/Ea22-like family protein [Klebsiella variicola subsp. variicola]
MTDITELAQSLKAAAENAIGAHERLAAYPYGEIIDISQHEGEQIDIDITDLNEFNKEANPVNILALVEALEKAQQRIDELDSRTVKLPKLKMLEDYLAEVAIEERKQILVGVKLEFHRACVAAGIKMEAE